MRLARKFQMKISFTASIIIIITQIAQELIFILSISILQEYIYEFQYTLLILKMMMMRVCCFRNKQWHGEGNPILEWEFPKLFCGKIIFDDDDDDGWITTFSHSVNRRKFDLICNLYSNSIYIIWSTCKICVYIRVL